MKIFRKSIVTLDKNLKMNLIIVSLMCINVTAISGMNMPLIDEITTHTSESFIICYNEVMASKWSCFWDASKVWQVDLGKLLREPPNKKEECCAFHDACNCMDTFVKNNDYCKPNDEYNNYFNKIVDLYAKNQSCIDANVGRNSTTCGASTNLLVNNINYIFYFITCFLLIINLFHSNLM